jgi:glycosyltransferase involved in cell wall biosynthesis
MPLASRGPRVLVLSWNYPTVAAPQCGLWVERMCDTLSVAADVTVLVPTPWTPPVPGVPSLTRFRRVPRAEQRGQVRVEFPRVLGSFTHYTHAIDARLAAPSVLRAARKLHRDRPFDLIHAHFIYPDGVVGSRIGRELGIPVMTSEHSFWTPWLRDNARVRAEVEAALPHVELACAVSEALRRNVDEFARGRVRTGVLSNVVDDDVFFPAPRERDPDELLYVGLIRKFKRVDVLLRALAVVRRTLPKVHLRVLAAKGLRAYARDRAEIDDLVRSLGLTDAVRFVEGSDAPAVAEAMRRCGFVVVSSGAGRETFCSVAAESLACGTPLVVTRCGGPEEFVTPEDGVMVAADDVQALADGILEAMGRRGSFDAKGIASRMVGRYGRAAWRERALSTYESVLSRDRSRVA